MLIDFYKYQGTGNDFIIIDQSSDVFELSDKQIAKICDRKFGVGADGLMYLRNKDGYDFHMIYFNSDGKESTMCGNGGRSICRFASEHQIVENKAYFLAVDGAHKALITKEEVSLEMIDVKNIEESGADIIMNTGSPHYIIFQDNIAEAKLTEIAKGIRYSERFKLEGVNVNLVENLSNGSLKMRTYERGVEEETLSCGTGVTAAAIAYALKNNWTDNVSVITKGGKLNVSFRVQNNTYHDIRLTGPAEFVFKGSIEL
jgi:diaminopimelate epimerase